MPPTPAASVQVRLATIGADGAENCMFAQSDSTQTALAEAKPFALDGGCALEGFGTAAVDNWVSTECRRLRKEVNYGWKCLFNGS